MLIKTVDLFPMLTLMTTSHITSFASTYPHTTFVILMLKLFKAVCPHASTNLASFI